MFYTNQRTSACLYQHIKYCKNSRRCARGLTCPSRSTPTSTSHRTSALRSTTSDDRAQIHPDSLTELHPDALRRLEVVAGARALDARCLGLEVRLVVAQARGVGGLARAEVGRVGHASERAVGVLGEHGGGAQGEEEEGEGG
jgi:hypothetical protein